MSNAALALEVDGLVLGRYRPLRPLGTGGSGSVWLARDEKNGLDVALKIVAREGKAAARAEREAHAAARLRHPSCLRAYAFARDPRHVYIAYEFVPGRTFREAMRAGELNDHDAIEGCAQICEGLAHAHRAGILHRDVKPSNVLLADGDAVSVRLLDFGLARMAEAETLTAQGDVPGTLAYIAPERLAGEDATEAADVWAVGVMLWEALAGRHPFWQTSMLHTARAIEAGARSARRAPSRTCRSRCSSSSTVRSRSTRRGGRRRPSSRGRCAARPPHGGGSARAAAGVELPRRRRRFRRAGSPRPGSRRSFAGWTAAALPFFPHGWAIGLAVAAAAATFYRERLGLVVALAVPILPLGNVSLGLAVVYAAFAAAWLALAWREPRGGLLFALGPLLAPLGAIGLVPLATVGLRAAAATRRAGGRGGARRGSRRRDPPRAACPSPESMRRSGSASPARPIRSTWSERCSAQPRLSRRCSSRRRRSRPSPRSCPSPARTAAGARPGSAR